MIKILYFLNIESRLFSLGYYLFQSNLIVDFIEAKSIFADW